MVKFRNAITGTDMWVADDRVEEYKAAGHLIDAPAVKTPIREEKPIEKPVEKVAAKRTSKKGK